MEVSQRSAIAQKDYFCWSAPDFGGPQGPPKTRHPHYDIALSKRALAVPTSELVRNALARLKRMRDRLHSVG